LQEGVFVGLAIPGNELTTEEHSKEIDKSLKITTAGSNKNKMLIELPLIYFKQTLY